MNSRGQTCQSKVRVEWRRLDSSATETLYDERAVPSTSHTTASAIDADKASDEKVKVSKSKFLSTICLTALIRSKTNFIRYHERPTGRELKFWEVSTIKLENSFQNALISRMFCKHPQAPLSTYSSRWICRFKGHRWCRLHAP